MSRNKKSRKTGAFMTVLERKPTKQERLADPTSKESRRKRSLEQRKKHKSVLEKTRATQSATERDTKAGRKGTRHGGPLAAKIRRLNAEKREQSAAADE
ncbi:hypothetical protein [Marinobacterium weihaiense]|uniref:Uncharacterized protein n=1 Tax=Marinobacterium weihaiense TaxID=2851016 RepID=A0ABS6M6E4_9GAMM|nr:hypothetical protein [Marinobacterium weihaiense]MBV0931755.1 hypothetical protein [Marinobacterium weihaiense]